MCINVRNSDPSGGFPLHLPLPRLPKAAVSAGNTPHYSNAARRIVGRFLSWRADALGVVITLQPGVVILCLSPRFFTLLVLASDARTTLQWGRGTASDVREFVVSDEALFCKVFDAGAIAGEGDDATWPTRLLRLLPQPGSTETNRAMSTNSTRTRTPLHRGAVWTRRALWCFYAHLLRSNGRRRCSGGSHAYAGLYQLQVPD